MNEVCTRITDPIEIETAYAVALSGVGTSEDRKANRRAVLDGLAGLYRLEGPNHAHGVAQISIIGAGNGDKPNMIVNEIAGHRVYTFGMMQLMRKLARLEGCGHVIHETPDTRKRRVLARLGFVYLGNNRMAMRV